ncbi:MAG: aspartate aminotransferase family protein [Candidatus Bathyarchaeia archaeon]
MRQEPSLSLDKTAIMDAEGNHTAPVYAKRKVVAVRGQGALLWDIDGKEYIDCMAGYGTTIVGHSHPVVVEAAKAQAEKLIACHASLYNDTRAQYVSKLIKVTPQGLTSVFLSNSGGEAVEAAIKLARKYTKKRGIIAMMRSFHGKTMGALSTTWDAKYRSPFEPLVPGVTFVPYGKPDRVRDAINDGTAAIIVEPIQGEGGVHVAPEGYLKQLREIADEKGALLIFDEIQTGFARTGKLFALEHWQVVPDVLCLAKSAGSGLPLGITVSRPEIMSSLRVGEHSSTFGGNPLVCAAASATLDVIFEERLWEKAGSLGEYFRMRLGELGERLAVIREIRGLGLMVGVETRFEANRIVGMMLDRGVIMLTAGANVLRFLPSAAITPAQIDTVVRHLEDSFRQLSMEKSPPQP